MPRYWKDGILVAVLMLGSSAVNAQDSLRLGTRIRVSIGVGPDRREVIGALTRSDAAVWILRLNEQGDSAVVPSADLTEVRVSLGIHRHIVEGLAIGALFGGVLGAATYREPSPRSCDPPTLCANWGTSLSGLDSQGFAIVSGVIGGGLLGAAIGARVKTERWKLVTSERAQLTMRPSGGGVGVGISLRF